MNRFFSARLGDLSAARGEKFVTSLVGGFSCPKNIDVENFLHNGAVVSAQMGSSITHLVFDQSDASCVGYFTLTHKPIVLPSSVLSLALQKKMKRFADLDGGTFLVSAFLIAQLAKNDAVDGGKRITGVNLLDLIYQQLKEVRSRIGGRVVFIECEQGIPKLTEFYKRNGFAKFDSRVSKVDGKTYDMMFRFLSMSYSASAIPTSICSAAVTTFRRMSSDRGRGLSQTSQGQRQGRRLYRRGLCCLSLTLWKLSVKGL